MKNVKKSLKPWYPALLLLGMVAAYRFMVPLNASGSFQKVNLSAPPITGEGVSVTIGNAAPREMILTLKGRQGQHYAIDYQPCQTCTIQTTAPKPGTGCPSGTVYKTFVLKPDTYQVTVGSLNGVGYTDSMTVVSGVSRKLCFYSSISIGGHRSLD